MSLESNDFYYVAEELLEYFSFLKVLEDDYALSCEDEFMYEVAPLREETKMFILSCGSAGILNADKEIKQKFLDDVAKLRGKILELLSKAKLIVGGYVSFTPQVKVRNFDSIQRAFEAMARLVSSQILFEKDESFNDEQGEVLACRIDEDVFRKEFFADGFLGVVQRQILFNHGKKYDEIFTLLLGKNLNAFVLTLLQDNFFGHIRKNNEDSDDNKAKAEQRVYEYISGGYDYLKSLLEETTGEYNNIVLNIIKSENDENNKYLIDKIDDVIDVLNKKESKC
ncbi:hypothetical protein [Campylobacter showae]|jgi:hypothetical protein|uniref:hypothetical protein n=1 Tax=Campylobacter showae TaxID=204 RepID=UPI000F07ACCD|nr:hypothetical protein [Campylobacter showae]